MCGLICHDRKKCPPCSKKSKQSCLCGNSVQERSCDDLVWHCEKTCNKLYACGLHTCQLKCHIGDCGDCPLGLPRECPCGKQVKLTIRKKSNNPSYYWCVKNNVFNVVIRKVGTFDIYNETLRLLMY